MCILNSTCMKSNKYTDYKYRLIKKEFSIKISPQYVAPHHDMCISNDVDTT